VKVRRLTPGETALAPAKDEDITVVMGVASEEF
jgi:hypothetical protein